MEIWQSASALARPMPIPGGLIRSGRRVPSPAPDHFERVLRRALFSSANVLLHGDTEHVETYLRSVLEKGFVSIDGVEDSPADLAGILEATATAWQATGLIRNVDRLHMNDQFGLLDMLEGDAYRRTPATQEFRLISTTKSDLGRATARDAFLASLLLRIGTISLCVPTDFFEVMSNRQKKFSSGRNVPTRRWEGARA